MRVFERSGHTPPYKEPGLFDAELLRWMKDHRCTVLGQESSGGTRTNAAEGQKDIQWGSSPPVFFGGAVVDVADSVHQKLSQFERPQSLTNDGPAVDVAPDAARQLSELSRGSR